MSDEARRAACEEQARLFPEDGPWITHTPALPEICLDLRMSTNGAADPWPTPLLREAVAMLRAREASWSQPSDDMDGAVLVMVRAAITLGAAELAGRKKDGW